MIHYITRMSAFLEHFRKPETAASYAAGPPRFMPGFADMQIMAAILMAERSGQQAEILVLGAGGGLELSQFAAMQTGWRMVGVDPAPAMLEQARIALGANADRVTLVEGTIEAAPQGPFDGACCLLTLHFLPAAERLATLRAVHSRLAPGAAFVAAHSSYPQVPEDRELWLDRYAAFALAKGTDPEMVQSARQAVEDVLPALTPEEDIQLMADAGFTNPTLFYAGFTWRGWVGYA